MSVLASAAVAKLTMIYPLPPLTDIVGLYRTVRLLSQRLGAVTLLAIAGSIVNTALVSRAQNKASARVYERMTETSVFLS